MSDQVERVLVYYETKIKSLKQQLSKAQADLELLVMALDITNKCLLNMDNKYFEDHEQLIESNNKTLKQIKDNRDE